LAARLRVISVCPSRLPSLMTSARGIGPSSRAWRSQSAASSSAEVASWSSVGILSSWSALRGVSPVQLTLVVPLSVGVSSKVSDGQGGPRLPLARARTRRLLVGSLGSVAAIMAARATPTMPMEPTPPPQEPRIGSCGGGGAAGHSSCGGRRGR
jgi:hypothetical protein